jgi:hypothetical protein
MFSDVTAILKGAAIPTNTRNNVDEAMSTCRVAVGELVFGFQANGEEDVESDGDDEVDEDDEEASKVKAKVKAKRKAATPSTPVFKVPSSSTTKRQTKLTGDKCRPQAGQNQLDHGNSNWPGPPHSRQRQEGQG